MNYTQLPPGYVTIKGHVFLKRHNTLSETFSDLPMATWFSNESVLSPIKDYDIPLVIHILGEK